MLLIFAALGMVRVLRDRRRLADASWISTYALAALGLLAVASLVQDINKSRSMLLVGSLLVLLASTLVAWNVVRQYGKKALPTTHLIAKAAIGYGLLSLLQLAIATFSQQNTLLCQGCKSDVFGFARVNGFALEPQFWANALLPFFVYGLVALYIQRSKLQMAGVFASGLAIMLTFSRGALIALFGAIVVFAAVLIYQRDFMIKRFAEACGIATLAFVCGFAVLVGAASIKYRDTPYIAYNTARGMVEQLSLGKIRLAKKEDKPAEAPAVQAVDVGTSQSAEPVATPTVQPVDTPTNQGVVEASQRDRVGPAKTAINVWRGSARNTLLGVGLGNFAPYVRQYVDPNSPLTLTVYIYYVLLLVETGVVGIVLFIIPYWAVFRSLIASKLFEQRAALIISAAFLMQYVFFGSYINVAYIWVWLGVALGLGVKFTDKHERHHKKYGH
jgi:hypothetical protein